ncbi:hypothetical protein HKX48_007304 [Thoreauomyces humboldtii]|nr:hypothetical protein HKX48_007304 [Thoreauomyces humboldtii]
MSSTFCIRALSFDDETRSSSAPGRSLRAPRYLPRSQLVCHVHVAQTDSEGRFASQKRARNQDCGFSRCQYRFLGLRIDESHGTKRLQSDWVSVKPEDAYQTFRRSRLGTAHWLQLIIETKKLGTDSESKKTVRCGVCQDGLKEEESGTCRFSCGHRTHGRCAGDWVQLGMQTCPVCDETAPIMMF